MTNYWFNLVYSLEHQGLPLPAVKRLCLFHSPERRKMKNIKCNKFPLITHSRQQNDCSPARPLELNGIHCTCSLENICTYNYLRFPVARRSRQPAAIGYLPAKSRALCKLTALTACYSRDVGLNASQIAFQRHFNCTWVKGRDGGNPRMSRRWESSMMQLERKSQLMAHSQPRSFTWNSAQFALIWTAAGGFWGNIFLY